jgi:hypothetical protein
VEYLVIGLAVKSPKLGTLLCVSDPPFEILDELRTNEVAITKLGTYCGRIDIADGT